MSIGGFKVGDNVEKYNYGDLDNIDILRDHIHDKAIDPSKLADSAYHNTADIFSEDKSYLINEYCILDGTLYRFTADKTAGAWDSTKVTAVALANNVDELRSILNAVSEVTVTETEVTEDVAITTTWTDGYYINSGGREQPNATYSYTSKLPCVEGDVFTGAIRFLCAYNSADVAIPNSGSNTAITEYTVPSGIASVIISTSTAQKNSIKKRIVSTEIENIYKDRIEGIETTLATKVDQTKADQITRGLTLYTSSNVFDYTTVTNGKFMNKDGTVLLNSSLAYSEPIPVSEGDVVTFWKRSDTDTNIIESSNSVRFLCAFDSSGNAVSASGAENVSSYTVPSGIASIVISVYGSLRDNKGMACINYTPTWYEEYGTRYKAKPEFLEDAFSEKTAQPKIAKGYATAGGDLASGESLTIPKTNIKKNRVLSFSANVTTFSKLTIGKNHADYGNSWIEITSEKVIVNNYQGSLSQIEFLHGITIADYLYISIVDDGNTSQTAKITIISNGSKYESESFTFQCDGNADYTVTSDGSVLTSCKFTFAASDMRKPLWIFGDSYISIGSSERLPYYLFADGFADNVLLNGYPGESPASAADALSNMITMGRPRIALWAVGMNGGSDTSSAIDPTYKTMLKRFLACCDMYDITPVLATIPTVPDRYHEKRNDYIRESGYRYVDFADAVGADSSGNWYSGMLSADNVHPTALGAITLYHRLLLDLPEISMA